MMWISTFCAIVRGKVGSGRMWMGRQNVHKSVGLSTAGTRMVLNRFVLATLLWIKNPRNNKIRDAHVELFSDLHNYA